MKLPFVNLPNFFLETPIAHRGFHNLNNAFSMGKGPENSKAAILAAANLGFAIEIDVQISSDFVPFVFHDYNLDRLSTGKGPIKDFSSQRIASFNLVNNENIPSLDEILSLLSGKTPLIIEIKDQDGFMGENVGVLEAKIAENLKNYDGLVAVMSFNPNSILEFGKLMPTIPRGLVTDSFDQKAWNFLPEDKLKDLASISSADELGISFISHRYNKLSSDIVSLHRKNSRRILSWTISNKLMSKKALRYSENITFEGFYPTF